MRKLDLENRKINYDSLEEYGFISNDKAYIYEKNILDNEFKVIIEISNDKAISKLIEIDVDDEYLLVDVEDAVGEYVGTIKEEYDKMLKDFINKCTRRDIFKSKQSKEVIKYIKDKYDGDLEFLWKKFDDNAIWRNKNNNKWYGALLTVKDSKLGGDSDDLIEILDLRYEKGKVNSVVDNKKVYPGYHMNKDSWITIKLDGSLDTKKIFSFIDNSYNLIATPIEWIIPANPKMFDIIGYFEKHDIVDWHKKGNMNVGDIVYIYMGAPYSAILYKCRIIESDNNIMLKLEKKYKEDEYPFSKLKELGVRAVRGARTITKELSKELNK